MVSVLTVNPSFALIGVPIDSAGTPGGTELAPSAFRALGLREVVGGVDLGDLDVRIRAEERDPVTGVVGLDDVCMTTATIRRSVSGALATDKSPSSLVAVVPWCQGRWRE